MTSELQTFFHLLKPKVAGARLMLKGARFWRSLLWIALGLATALGIEALSAWFLRRTLSVELVGPLLPRRLLTLVIVVLAAVLVVSTLINSFSTFFLSRDLPLLVWTPVPAGPLFFARLVEMLVHSCWMVLLFSLPVFVAYGRVYQAPASFYLALAPLLAVFFTIVGALGAALALVMTALLSARRSRDLMLMLAVVGFVILYLALRLARPERLLEEDSFGSMMEFLNLFQAPEAWYLPNRWLADLLWAWMRRKSLPWLEMWSLVFTSGALCAVCGWLGGWLYWPAYSRAQQGQVRGGKASHRHPRRILGSWLDGFGRLSLGGTLLVKDVRIFLRDPAQWTQLVLLVALGAVYLLNFVYLRHANLGWFVLYTVNHVLMGLVLAGIAVRFVFPAVSLEGRSWWLVRAAPVDLGRFLHSKLINHLVPLGLVAAALAAASALIIEVPLIFGVISVALALSLAWGVCTLGVGLGAWRPRFTAENPAKIPTGAGGIAYMLCSIAFVMLELLATVYPTFVLYQLPRKLQHPIARPQWFISSLAVFVFVLLAATVLPMWLGRRELEKDQHF
jgi:ABC-2 type transport system permease protein